MKFNVVIGNPPYQDMTGGGDFVKDAMPLYHKFVLNGMYQGKNVVMIIPTRWMCGGKSVLNDFRDKILESGHLEKLVVFDPAVEVFRNVKIAGGVQYFKLNISEKFKTTEVLEINTQGKFKADRCLTDYKYKDRLGRNQYLAVPYNRGLSIVSKILKISDIQLTEFILLSLLFDNWEEILSLVLDRKNYVISNVLKYSPFGLEGDFEDSPIKTDIKNIKVVKSFDRITWTDRDSIKSNLDILDKYKVCMGKIYNGDSLTDYRKVINKPFILKPGEICSQSYLVVYTTDSLTEAKHIEAYIKTRFVRYLINLTLTSMNIMDRNFIFVPKQDWTRLWTDTDLYNKYKLSSDEIDLIEKSIKQWKD